jgi:hypothetical protein
MSRKLRRGLLIGTAIAAALTMSQPTLAFVQTGSTGRTGAHVVTDTESLPGATCSYRFNSTTGQYKLRHISVFAPRMKAVRHMGSEKVGWRFVVQRRLLTSAGYSAWNNRYTSPMWTVMTDASHYADFVGHEGVSVTVPYPYGGSNSASYRVLLKMVWYRHDGTTVLGTIDGQFEWYNDYQGRADNIRDRDLCPDYEAPVTA